MSYVYALEITYFNNLETSFKSKKMNVESKKIQNNFVLQSILRFKQMQ